MNETVTPFAATLLLITLSAWGITELVAHMFEKMKVKEERLSQAILHILPFALGVAIPMTPGSVSLFMTAFGYEPFHPPEGTDMLLPGALCGVAAVLFHHRIKSLIRKRLRILDDKKEAPRGES